MSNKKSPGGLIAVEGAVVKNKEKKKLTHEEEQERNTIFLIICLALNCLLAGVNIGLCIAKWFLV